MHQRRRAVYPPPANPVHPTPLSLSPPDPPPAPPSPFHPLPPLRPSRCKSVYTSRIPRRCAFPYGNMSDCAVHYTLRARTRGHTPRTFKTGGIATNYNGYGMAVGEEKRLISREPAARGGGEWGGRWTRGRGRKGAELGEREQEKFTGEWVDATRTE